MSSVFLMPPKICRYLARKLPVAAGKIRLGAGVRVGGVDVCLTEGDFFGVFDFDLDALPRDAQQAAFLFPEGQVKVAAPDVGLADAAEVVVRGWAQRLLMQFFHPGADARVVLAQQAAGTVDSQIHAANVFEPEVAEGGVDVQVAEADHGRLLCFSIAHRRLFFK